MIDDDKLVSFSEISYEMATLGMEITSLDDESLVDECNHLLAFFYNNDDIDDTIAKFMKNGKFTEEERKKVESFYILAHGDLQLEE